jgi:hypothetical protein
VVEVGDALRGEGAAVGLASLQLAGHADACDGDGKAPRVVDGAVLDAGMEDRAQRDSEGSDDDEAQHAERLQQREPRAARSHTRVRSATAQCS